MDQSIILYGTLCSDVVANAISHLPPYPKGKPQVGEFFSHQILVKDFASLEKLVLVFLTEAPVEGIVFLYLFDNIHQRIQALGGNTVFLH